ncbi:hypothetical protein MON38_05075 [Hymenobacter sp. DH14]|uniref:Uncharacterized protein n=1 Tax=Hymenobacter cyanobacteriorum TaxID=2926463 RepID=A0A9X1VDA2_9BACT|nr:hypothetical protein [Hymenobacter cyanobacteriorum]MCI1186781.1 hypothetical protein [Hymenobacter cyanobacteriorum]
MKQLSVFALLAVFLYNLVGVYPVALWRQHEFRRVAEARRRAALPDRALVRVAVAQHAEATDLVWHEAGEFSYRGHLFDVVRQHARPDSTIYFCWPDRGEEHLLASLAEHVREFAQPDAGTRKSAQKVLDYLAKLYLLPAAETPASTRALTRAQRLYPEYTAVPCSRPLSAPFAPPRQVTVA